ncbi:MAG: molybdate ABC transporter substrate-binding protein [Candidatus Riflebacteria bacterium]|nr:molybdate ABC transporter substrate-binding protein [Candidatus Riflebacteria bacterium]
MDSPRRTRPQRRRPGAILFGALLSIVLACDPSTVGNGEEAHGLIVFAASSLTEPFREIAAIFEKRYQHAVRLNFAGSSELRAQMENGAHADVFAAASEEEMKKAEQSSVVTSPPALFARNRLVIVVPTGNPGKIALPKDLARPGLRFVTSQPAVPVGRYTLEMLDRMSRSPEYGPGFREAVLRNVVSQEMNARQVLAKVQLGEADVAVVYASDVAGRVADKVQTVEVPAPFNVEAVYPVAIVGGTRREDRARQFVDLIVSAEGQAVLGRFKFLPARP